MEQYFLYFIIVLITVSSPGPGVILTLSNAIQHGIKPAIVGAVGISLGILVIAIISASSLGLLLATSAYAFTLLKFIGAAYLIYLGIKLWRSPALKLKTNDKCNNFTQLNYWKRFKEGFFVSLLNPKPIFFFMSLFPQFINHEQSYFLQLSYLTLTFCIIVLIVHSAYIFGANSIKGWLSSDKGSNLVTKVGGSVFILFGLGLASSNR